MSSTTFTPATLTRAFHAESIKAFSTRSMALGIVAAGTVTLATVAALAGLIPDGDLNPEWAAYGLLTTGMPILLVWAASVFFGEIGNGMLRATYLTVPRRGVVFLAKAAFAAVVSVVAVLLVLPLSSAVFATSMGAPSLVAHLLTPAGLSLLARAAFVVACWAVIAVSVAAITRHLAVSVGVIISMYLFIEAYLGSIPGAAWLPYVLPFSSGKSLLSESSGVTLASPGLAAVGQLAVTLVIAGVAWWVTARRDTK